jgi:hypothetical protein
MVLKPALNYTRHRTRRGFVGVTVPLLIQLKTALIQSFEMCVASLWRVCVRGKACLQCARLFEADSDPRQTRIKVTHLLLDTEDPPGDLASFDST